MASAQAGRARPRRADPKYAPIAVLSQFLKLQRRRCFHGQRPGLRGTHRSLWPRSLPSGRRYRPFHRGTYGPFSVKRVRPLNYSAVRSATRGIMATCASSTQRRRGRLAAVADGGSTASRDAMVATERRVWPRTARVPLAGQGRDAFAHPDTSSPVRWFTDLYPLPPYHRPATARRRQR